MSGDEPASKVCYAEESDPAYMGYATREEIAELRRALAEGGQGAVEKLRALLPRIRDDALHAELKARLEREDGMDPAPGRNRGDNRGK